MDNLIKIKVFLIF